MNAKAKTCLKTSSQGFTLIELLVVIAIIGILSTLAIVAVSSARQKARDSKRVADLSQIGKALELYYTENNSYPTLITAGQPIASGGTVYISSIPSNPSPRTDGGCPNQDYQYKYVTATNTYVVSGCIASTQGSFSSGPVGYYTGSGLVNCGGTISDADGYTYPTVLIGGQCWMAQGLQTKTKPDGTCIIGGSPPCADAAISDSGLARMCRGATNVESNCPIYGATYTWTGAMNGSTTAGARGICPTGWHIPSHDEVSVLERAVCTSASCSTDFPFDVVASGWRGTDESAKLRNGGTYGWNAIMYSNSMGIWTSTKTGNFPWYRTVSGSLGTTFRSTDSVTSYYQIRCVKD